MVTALFLFHRDLRIEDNSALNEAIKHAEHVLPVFIFTPEQIDEKQNKYFSHPAVQFMVESLINLDKALNGKLGMFRGDTINILGQLYKKYKFDCIYANRDYSRYAIKRDKAISDWCKLSNIKYIDAEDYDLIPLAEGLRAPEQPYTVLSPYYKRFLKNIEVKKPETEKTNVKFINCEMAGRLNKNKICSYFFENKNIAVHGGREEGLKVLARIKKGEYNKYNSERDYPAQNKTTKASAYLRFGCISIREMYWTLRNMYGRDNGLIRELVFRSFYLKIYAYKPELQNGVAYRNDIDSVVPWRKDQTRWKAWSTGHTGFPLCDAGMRQLIGENWVHNRVRMLIANVATKYLLLDWRECMRYFYQNLVDADIFSNTAGWQWGSGVGVDSAPYFRAPFNPFLQSDKFDKDGIYIKRWIPELAEVTPRDIHNWGDAKVRAKYPNCKYPAPIIDQKTASAYAVATFRPKK
jgi:deoxyribodipyrimidine photo-lyase